MRIIALIAALMAASCYVEPGLYPKMTSTLVSITISTCTAGMARMSDWLQSTAVRF